MVECEQCNESGIKEKMIGVKTDIVRYFCNWECLSLYCSAILVHFEDDYEKEL